MLVIARNVRRSSSQRSLLCRALCLGSLCPIPLDPKPSTCRRTFHFTQPAGAKRVSRKQVKELVQGQVGGAPLPPADKDDLRQESLQDVVRNNTRKFPNCVLLIKVGNFYELYDKHAEEFAPKLGLRRAAKGKEGIAMAGFQLPQLDKYLKILVQDLDKHVAICEEFPDYVDGKLQSPIPRRVTRVITPGTLIDEEFVEQDKNNFLLSIQYSKTELEPATVASAADSESLEKFGLAWIDISTGEFFLQTTDRAGLLSSLLRVGANEVVLSSNINAIVKEQIATCLGLNPSRLTSLLANGSLPQQGHAVNWMERLDRSLPQADRSQITDLEGLACQQLFDYVDIHLLETKFKPKQPQRIRQTDNMSIDRSSIKGLELLKTARDGLGKGSLINTIQRTVTKGGSRLLRERLIYPSVVPQVIEYRLDLVSAFLAEPHLHQSILVQLRDLFDIRRIAQKFALNKGDAEDLVCLAKSIAGVKDIIERLSSSKSEAQSKRQVFTKLISQIEIDGLEHLYDQIKKSIDERRLFQLLTRRNDEPAENADGDGLDIPKNGVTIMTRPQTETTRISADKYGKEDAWIMQKGASPGLQRLHAKLEALEQERCELQESLRQTLSAPRLVLKFDTKFGHICQTPKSKNFDDSAFDKLGAVLVGNLRTIRSFYVTKWTKLGKEMENVKFEIQSEEQKIFHQLRQLVVDNLVPLRQNASAMDELDVAASFATLALDEDWTRPAITTKTVHTIVGGRHPTVKAGLQQRGHSFVRNDLTLDRKTRAWLITGPNMAGKSTFLRQNALITILAQVGSYVPAEFAEIGVVDKIFSRIGAADDLFRNESTFMVEMLETASILRDATERSFVIMDEVGRGTAPEDGTAVAYASLHHLYHVNQCRTLFATHFHNLADQTQDWSRLSQYCTDLYEDDAGAFTFVHRLRPGVNKKSHALRVAKMAGVPSAALDIAHAMLAAGGESEDAAG